MSVLSNLRNHWCRFADELFLERKAEIDPLPRSCGRFVAVLELVPPRRFDPGQSALAGGPVKDRAALARASLAKSAWNRATTIALIELPEAVPARFRASPHPPGH
ncbi:MAG: hypothetical protein OXH79_07210 [Boseongicola sp.]|nr:hypothetical protein [Boseongicola sp.]